ncbi:hypothetical protein PENSPDRAFT_253331 [Peniophora sp. CONT]|nr:hypothetical protein PENSPDRAFT_253331 [Peniophora sp. CONT]
MRYSHALCMHVCAHKPNSGFGLLHICARNIWRSSVVDSCSQGSDTDLLSTKCLYFSAQRVTKKTRYTCQTGYLRLDFVPLSRRRRMTRLAIAPIAPLRPYPRSHRRRPNRARASRMAARGQRPCPCPCPWGAGVCSG